MTNAGRDRSIPNSGYGFFTTEEGMGEHADDALEGVYTSHWESDPYGNEDGFDPTPAPKNVHIGIEVLRKTDKAVLARTDEFGDVWMPLSKVCFSANMKSASVPKWLEVKWHQERNGQAVIPARAAVPPGRRKAESKGPRPMTVVKYRDDLPEDMLKTYTKTYGMTDMGFLFVGEILNMPGHGLFINRYNDKTLPGLHIDSFRELTENET